MNDSIQGAAGGVPSNFATPAPVRAPPRRLEIRFTGSGSEYFRIWIVNLLLTLITLTLYHPFAKVRRLRYFYANTLVDDHALGFHGDPWTMLRGYLLVAAMLALYSVAGQFSAGAGLVAFAVVAGIWPALIKSSLQFRMANTSWRGLRFRFTGTVAEAYRATLPLFVPGLVLLAALLGVPDQERPPAWYGAVLAVVTIGAVACAPWLWWSLKKYQHDHLAYGPLQTELQCGAAPVYAVFGKTLGVALLGALALGALFFLLVLGVGMGSLGDLRGPNSGKRMAAMMIIGFAVFGVGVLAVQLVPRPYFTSRMQNLLWSRTVTPRTLRFNSALRFRPLFGLTLKNWLLVVLTLGLYWPFAAIATARLRLEAVNLDLALDPQTLVDQGRALEGEAAGDAAGDLFGLDIGL